MAPIQTLQKLGAGLPGGSGLIVNGQVMGWGHVRLNMGVGGLDLPYFSQFADLITAISWTETPTTQLIYGKGNLPRGVEMGPYSCTGSITVYLEGYYWLLQLVEIVTGAVTLAAQFPLLEPGQKAPLPSDWFPVGVTREDFPALPLIVTYSHNRPEIAAGDGGFGYDLARSFILPNSASFQTLLPAVKFYGLDRRAASGDHTTLVTIPFTCLGRPVEAVVPFL